MDEEPCKRGEIERPPRPQGFRERSEGAGERTQRVGGLVGQRSLGLDVEDPDSGPAGEQRDRELRRHARQRRDVVRVRVHVGRELWAREPDRAAGDPALDRDPVRDDRVAALRDEPETPVLEHEDRRHRSGDSFVEGVDRSLDRRGRIVVGANLLRRSVRGRGEQTGVDGPDDTRSRRGRLHACVIGARCPLLETGVSR